MALTSAISGSFIKRILAGALLVSTALYAPAGQASIGDGDPMIEGAKLCTRYLPRHERQYGIPVHLLAAIASTESGRYHKGIGLTIPWPWTINAEGKGYFFDSKEEAIRAVQKLQSQGVKSIDVGCMQVNLRHHPGAFANLNEAFEPRYNVAYAASFLRRNYDDLGSWKAAAAAYHSRTPEYGNRYIGLVYNTWNKILTKIAQAKSGTTSLASSADTVKQFDPSGVAPLTREDLRGKFKDRKTTTTAELAPQPAPEKKQYRAPVRMKVIELVKRDTSKESGVLVIRPENTEQQIASVNTSAFADTPIVAARSGPLAEPQPADTQSTQALAAIEPAAGGNGQFAPRSKLIRINRMGKSTVETSGSTRKQPQFVFEN